MDQIELLVLMLSIIVAVGVFFSQSAVPTALILVIVGMLVSIIPHFPEVTINPTIILNIFLPLLLYVTSAESSWRDVRLNLRPIVSLSIGHVLFITGIVAITVHALIPQLGWPLAFVLGAVISPPDDVAIIPIAEKIQMPRQVLTVLKGEALLNDATALTVFRFALAALVTHQFSVMHAVTGFCAVIVGETLYGLFVGHVLGQLRLRIKDPLLQVLTSLMTPFIAYLPAEHLGGSGVLATVVTGLVIGHVYLERFAPDVRLVSRSVWATLGFALQSLLFLLVD